MKFLAVTLVTLCMLGQSVLSQNRFWVAGAAATWSSNSWAATSGGAPDGGGPPAGAQSAVFDGNGLGNCTVDVAAAFDGMNVAAAYTGTIDLNGQTFTVSGTNACTFAGGTINDTPGTTTLSVSTSGLSTFSGTIFGAVVTSARAGSP